MKIKLFVPLVILLLLLLSTTAHAGEYRILTNQLPPIKFQRDGVVQGIAMDVLLEIARMSGMDLSAKDARVAPWDEIYRTTLDTPGTICLTMAKTPKRAPLFKWVGPIYKTRLGLLAKKSAGVRIESLKDAASYDICSIIESAPERLLVAGGIPAASLIRTAASSDGVRMLDNGSVDLFAFAKTPAFYVMMQQGMDPKKYEMVYEMRTAELYIAFNRETDDAVIAGLQRALDDLKAQVDGTPSRYDRIVMGYFAPGL